MFLIVIFTIYYLIQSDGHTKFLFNNYKLNNIMNINYPMLFVSIVLVFVMVAIGLDGAWMVIPALILLNAFSKKKTEIQDEKIQISEIRDNSEVSRTGIKSKLPILLIALFIVSVIVTAINKQKFTGEGYQVYDVILPFPGIPSESKQSIGGGITLTHYIYSPENSHLNYVSAVYNNLPDIEDPTATILRGFNRGHDILSEQEVQLPNVTGTYVKLNTETPEETTLNVIAFEYKSTVYLWIVTFENHNAIGNEEEQFFSDLNKIEFK